MITRTIMNKMNQYKIGRNPINEPNPCFLLQLPLIQIRLIKKNLQKFQKTREKQNFSSNKRCLMKNN